MKTHTYHRQTQHLLSFEEILSLPVAGQNTQHSHDYFCTGRNTSSLTSMSVKAFFLGYIPNSVDVAANVFLLDSTGVGTTCIQVGATPSSSDTTATDYATVQSEINTFCDVNSLPHPSSWLRLDTDPAVVPAYTSYQALVSQTGTAAPTASNVAVSGFAGTTFAWSRTATGTYRITASAAVFTANKTSLVMSNPSAFLNNFKYSVISTTVIEIQTATLSVISLLLTPGNADALLSNTQVEIRVYP